MDESNGNAERREFPRTTLELPLEYRGQEISHLKGGLAINVSEGGLLIHLVNDLPVGTKLTVGVLFPKEFELSRFEAAAQIVWKEIYCTEDWTGYQYGLRFVEIKESDFCRLEEVLVCRLQEDQVLETP